MKSSTIVLTVLVAAVAGLSIFGYMAWHSVTLERSTTQQAIAEFAEIHHKFGAAEPMLRIKSATEIARLAPQIAGEPQALSSLNALVFKENEQILSRVSIPFWFFKLKAPALQLSLHDTDIDLKRLGVSAADLEKHGPGLVLDEARPNGDRLIVWTE